MHKKNKLSRSLVIYTLIFILLLVVMFVINQKESDINGSSQKTAEPPSISGQPVTGEAGSSISIVEFGDYKCPSCKAWGEQVWPQLKQDYIDTGIASFAYVNTLFHGDESILAAQASEVVYMNYPERFWDFHKTLFDEQPQSSLHDDLWVTEEKVLEVAQATIPELDADKFMQSLTLESIQQRLDEDQMLVEKFNITQTPTLIINNNVIANPFDYDEIRKVIEQESN